MTTDNRTNEPTEVQVEAAAKSLARSFGTRIDVIPEWLDGYVEIARAALVAAQGAAPQAESGPALRACGHPDRPGFICACIIYPEKAAPVLPSSGVDEEALAEVIARSRGFGNGWEQIPPLTREAYREVARAVAEWLEGQGRGSEM